MEWSIEKNISDIIEMPTYLERVAVAKDEENGEEYIPNDITSVYVRIWFYFCGEGRH